MGTLRRGFLWAPWLLLASGCHLIIPYRSNDAGERRDALAQDLAPNIDAAVRDVSATDDLVRDLPTRDTVDLRTLRDQLIADALPVCAAGFAPCAACTALADQCSPTSRTSPWECFSSSGDVIISCDQSSCRCHCTYDPEHSCSIPRGQQRICPDCNTDAGFPCCDYSP